jgi:hypothetical protein
MRPSSARAGTAGRTRPSVGRPSTADVAGRPSTAAGSRGGDAAGAASRMMVAVRVRPPNRSDPDEAKVVVAPDPLAPETLCVDDGRRGRSFAFDHVFTGGQEEVFDTMGRPMIEEALKGFNVCLFAYGQTGSGKTHSIQGGAGPDAEGLVPRFVRDMFRAAQARVDADADLTVKVAMSYVEVYMERVRDLLVPRVRGQEPENLELHEVNHRVVAKGATVHSVLGPDRVVELMATGNANRQTAETRMNEVSSRSHSIVQFTISQLHEAVDRRDTECTVTLVDLAGSERQGKTESSGVQLEEAKKINQSLLVLGRALNSFSDGRGDMVSLRDSKLTRLLSDCFGGNAKTWMLATVSPTAFNVTESLSTLEYATHAKNITNSVTVNAISRRLEYNELIDRERKLRAALDATRAEKDEWEARLAAATAANQDMQARASAFLEADADVALAEAVKRTTRVRELLKMRLARMPPAQLAARGLAVGFDPSEETPVLPCFSASCMVDLSGCVTKGFEYGCANLTGADLDCSPTLEANGTATVTADSFVFDVQLLQVRGLPLRCRGGASVRFQLLGHEDAVGVPVAAPRSCKPDPLAPRFDFNQRYSWRLPPGATLNVAGVQLRVMFLVSGFS